MPSTLNISEILPGYTLTSTSPTKASLPSVFAFGGAPADGDQITITALGSSVNYKFVTALSGATPADTVEIVISTTPKTRLAKAINGDSGQDANIDYGTSSATNEAEGQLGVDATADSSASVSLESEDAGAVTITAALVGTPTNITLGSTTTDTGTDSSGTMNIPLSALGFTENALTTTEVAEGASDFRKFLYHMVEKYYLYLSKYEEIDTVTISTAGQDYVVGDLITFSGGSPDTNAVAAVASINSTGGITSVSFDSATYPGTTKGKAYESAPTGFSVATTAGYDCVLSATITDRLPTNLTINRGSLTENFDTETLSRLYQITLGFESSALSLKDE